MIKHSKKQHTNPSLGNLDQQNLFLVREDDYESQSFDHKNNNQLVVNITDTRYPIVKRVLKDLLGFKIFKDQSKEWDLTWTDNAVQPQTLMKMKPYQKINHFPGMYNLSRKNYLARNLIKMYKSFPNDYDFFPKTWSLPSQYNDLKQCLQNDQNSVVIAKPEASCQGKGIFLTKNIDDFGLGEHYVVQKYMKKPLLIDDLKFDLRIYVLVAGCDPLRLYIYKQGLARFATELYSAPKKENFHNLYMHLTNYAINKGNSKFQFNQSQVNTDTGHKRSLTSIFKKLDELGHNSNDIWQQICQLITKSFISVQPTLSHQYKSCQPDNISNNMCFQILGFDIILQSSLKPYILQVNYTPSFTTDTPLDIFVKENLIKDTLILMNVSNKFKHDVLNMKKKEIMERTLTGKKTWQSKEDKDRLIEKYKRKRDHWEDNHLGNFEKLYPVDNKVLMQKYETFLNYSKDRYLIGTGGNIKRNHKVSVASHNCLQARQSQKQIQKIQKLTNTDQLQRIYIKKPKLMTSFINKRQIKKQMVLHREKSRIQDQNDKVVSLLPTVEINYKPFQKSKYNGIQKIEMIRVVRQNGSNQKKALSQVEYRSSSGKNGSRLSKIYNIAFKEMKVK